MIEDLLMSANSGPTSSIVLICKFQRLNMVAGE
jgi:hypothetical protein